MDSEVSPLFTVKAVAELLRSKLVSEFSSFDDFIRAGAFKKEMLPPPGDGIVEYTVSGFDQSSAPSVYSVAVGVNWSARVHTVPPIESLYPGPRRNLHLFPNGQNAAILQTSVPGRAIAREFSENHPAEYAAITKDLDIDLEHMVSVGRALVALEVAKEPRLVGYPLDVMIAGPNGRTSRRSYSQ